MIYYWREVKMDHADFALWMDMFLPKNSISESTSILKTQKLSDYSQLKWIKIPIIKPTDINHHKKQKSNLMVSFRKVKYIRRRKTHNRHYY